jgi:hypothetical protein
VVFGAQGIQLMPKKIDDVVDELNDMIRLAGGPVVTMTWADFYGLCDVVRFKKERGDEIVAKAKDKYGLIVGYGNQAVLVAHDRNFAGT